jgi:hypothetical protein
MVTRIDVHVSAAQKRESTGSFDDAGKDLESLRSKLATLSRAAAFIPGIINRFELALNLPSMTAMNYHLFAAQQTAPRGLRRNMQSSAPKQPDGGFDTNLSDE